MRIRYFALGLMILFLSLLEARVAKAADEPQPGVARVSMIHGDVSTQRGDSGDWVATTINAPLVRGDKVSTGARSRTEIELDYANILRLDQRAEAKIADLTRTRIQLQVARGTVNYTVFKGTEADVEIDTPNMAAQPLGEGSYRIQVNSSAETEVTVSKGEVEISTPQGSTTVEKGQTIFVRGTDNPEYQVSKAPRRDEWDDWNRERDKVIQDAQSWTHTNRYYTGAHDLDRYGRWVNVPGYGEVWSPNAESDWVPYHDGRWVWEPYWGWTWVSYEPWGWAPYHYGRWFSYGSSWYWWPGHAGFFPTWAPAWVSFIGFGFGRHFGFGFGFNSIGWCPLGPFDTFFPWWGFRNTFNVINVTNVTNVTNVRNVTNVTNVPNGTTVTTGGSQPALSNLQNALTNANARRAITTVSSDDFAKGRVPAKAQGVDAAALRDAHVVSGTLPVVPTRDSLRPVDRPASVPGGSVASANADRFFTRGAVPARPESFAERQAGIQQMVQNYNPLAPSVSGQAAAREVVNPSRSSTSANPAQANAERAPATLGQSTPAGMATSNRSKIDLRPGGLSAQQNAQNNSQQPGSRGSATAGGPASGMSPGDPGPRSETVQASRATPPGVQPGNQHEWRRFGSPKLGPPPGGSGPASAGGFAAGRPQGGIPPTNFPPGQGAQPATSATEITQRTSNPPQAKDNQGGQTTQQAPRPWQRFGAGSSQPMVGKETPAQAPADNRPALHHTVQGPAQQSRPSVAQQTNQAPASREVQGPGWQRFATGAERTVPPTGASSRGISPAGTSPATRELPTPQVQSSPQPPTERPGWQSFRSAPNTGGTAPQGFVPRGSTAPGTFSSGSPERAPAFTSPRPESPRSEQPGAGGGWNRFPSRSGPSVSREAPSSYYSRPPLEINRPIVTERAPRGFEGGGPPRGGWGGGGGGGSRGLSPGSQGVGDRSSRGRSAPPSSSSHQSEQHSKR